MIDSVLNYFQSNGAITMGVLAFLSDTDSVVYSLLNKLSTEIIAIKTEVQSGINKLPKVEIENNENYISNSLKSVFNYAELISTDYGDSYISSELLLLSLIEKDNNIESIYNFS